MRKPADAATGATLLRVAEEQGALENLLADLRERANASEPAAADAACLLSNLLRQRDRDEEALAALKQALELAPEHLGALQLRGELLLQAGQPAEGLASLQKASEVMDATQPKTAATRQVRRQILEKLARAYFELDQAAPGEAALRRLLDATPGEAALRTTWAEYLEQKGHPALAVEMFQWLAENAPAFQRATALREIARLQTTRGLLAEAEQALRRGLELAGPGHWLREDLQARLTKLLMRRGGIEEFKAQLLSKHERATRDLRALMDLRQLAENLGNAEEQLQWQRKIVEVNPSNQQEQTLLLELELESGNHEQALALVRRLRERQPANLTLALRNAEVQLRAGQAEQAAEFLRKLWVENAGDAAFLSQLETFLRAQYMPTVLVEFLQWQVGREPGAPELRVRLAEAQMQVRDFAAARATLQGLADEADPPARRAAASYRAFGVLQAGGDAEGALAALQLAVQLDPIHAPYSLELARTLTENGDVESAQALLERIITQLPDPADPVYAQVDQRLFELLRGQSRADAPSVESSFAERQRRERLKLRSATDAVERQEWVLPPELMPKPPESAGGTAADPAAEAAAETPLAQYVVNLAMEAAEKDSVGAWLRLGRWLAWQRDYEEARTAARRAWDRQPGAVAVGLLLFNLVGQEQEMEDALNLLSQLEAAAGDAVAPKTEFLKKRADLLARAGRPVDSLEALREITRLNPQVAGAWQELAVALQRTGLWFDALEAWQKALETSHLDNKLAVMCPYLGALNRLQLHARAYKLLDDTLAAAATDEERLKVFDELVSYAQTQDELDRLVKEYTAKLEQQPNHAFLRQAQARLMEAKGEGKQAAATLAQVAWLTPNSLRLLQDLADRAEAAQDFESAVRYLSEAAREPKVPAQVLEKLAVLQEKVFDYEAARASWEQALSIAPKNVPLLRSAAEFHLRRDFYPEARALLERALEVDGYEQELRFLLAQLLLEEGSTQAARAQLEILLEQLPHLPEEPGGLLAALPPFELPETLDLAVPVSLAFDQVIRQDDLLVRDAAREFWRSDNVRRQGIQTTIPKSRLRLEVIAAMGRLVDAEARTGTDPVVRQKWMLRWRGNSSSAERLWAAYYSKSEYDLWLISQPLASNATEQRDSALQAFVWLNLDAGGYENLARWLQQSDPHRELRRQFFLVSLCQQLAGRQILGEGVDDLEALFPPETSGELLWAGATLMASTEYLHMAIRLGQRAMADKRYLLANNGLTLATWYLQLGQDREAVALLRQQVTAGETQSLTVHGITTRWAYLLLPPGERGPFVEWLERLGTSGGDLPPAHRELSLVIAHALHGNSAKANAAVDRLVDMRPTSYEEIPIMAPGEVPSQAHAFWNFVFITGYQLLEWRLSEQGCRLWERPLADPALIALQDAKSRDVARTVRKYLYTERMVTSREIPATGLVREYLRGTNEVMDLRILSGQLEEQQLYPELATLTEVLAQREQDHELSPDRLLRIYLQAGDLTAARRRLAELRLAATQEGEAPLRAHQAAMLFAHFLQESGQLIAAQEMLEQQLKDFPGDTECLQRLIGLYEARGLHQKVVPLCETFLRLFPDSAELYIQWATSMEKVGQAEAALTSLQERFPAGHVLRPPLLPVMFNLHIALDQVPRAEAALREMLETDQPASNLRQGAAILSQRGRTAEAAEILRGGLRRNRAPMYQFELLQGILTELLEKGHPPGQARQDLRQMAQLSRMLEGTRATVYQVRLDVARTLGTVGELRQDLEREWRDGLGAKEAGAALLELEITEAKPDVVRAQVLIAKLLDHGALPEDMADRMLEWLSSTGKHWGLVLDATRRLRKRSPGNFELAMHEVNALYKLGEQPAAEALLRKLEAFTLINAQDALPLARMWHSWGNLGKSRDLYAVALPTNQAFLPDEQAEYIVQMAQAGETAVAAERLVRYYRSGAQTNFAPLLTFLRAQGKLGPGVSQEPDVGFIRLSERATLVWRGALLEYALGENYVDLALNLVRNYRESVLQKPDQIQALLEKAPDFVPALRLQAGYMVEQGATIEAGALLERIVKLAPADSEDAADAQEELRLLEAAAAAEKPGVDVEAKP